MSFPLGYLYPIVGLDHWQTHPLKLVFFFFPFLPLVSSVKSLFLHPDFCPSPSPLPPNRSWCLGYSETFPVISDSGCRTTYTFMLYKLLPSDTKHSIHLAGVASYSQPRHPAWVIFDAPSSAALWGIRQQLAFCSFMARWSLAGCFLCLCSFSVLGTCVDEKSLSNIPRLPQKVPASSFSQGITVFLRAQQSTSLPHTPAPSITLCYCFPWKDFQYALTCSQNHIALREKQAWVGMHILLHLILASSKKQGEGTWMEHVLQTQLLKQRLFLRIQHSLDGLPGRPGVLSLHGYSFHAGLQAEVTQVDCSDWPGPRRPLCRDNWSLLTEVSKRAIKRELQLLSPEVKFQNWPINPGLTWNLKLPNGLQCHIKRILMLRSRNNEW